MHANQVTQLIIGGAIDIHRELGPGLLESTYQGCLVYELLQRGLVVEREKAIRVKYKDVRIDCGYRIDLLVQNVVVVELKSVDKLEPIHAAQMLTYLKLSGFRVGLLINFNVPVLREGIRRFVHGFPEPTAHARALPQ